MIDDKRLLGVEKGVIPLDQSSSLTDSSYDGITIKLFLKLGIVNKGVIPLDQSSPLTASSYDGITIKLFLKLGIVNIYDLNIKKMQ